MLRVGLTLTRQLIFNIRLFRSVLVRPHATSSGAD